MEYISKRQYNNITPTLNFYFIIFKVIFLKSKHKKTKLNICFNVKDRIML